MSSQAMTLAVPRRRRAFFRAGWGKQLMLQAVLVFISFTVLFPLVWVVSMSLDPRNISRPTELTLIPPGAALPPLFVFLNKIQISSGDFSFNLRNSLLGVGLALTSGALPFAIWNLKGYIDTIPKELEEAASLDGASPTQTFLRIMLPLATPALAVTAFLGFLTGWTEFVMSWQFLTNPENFTLAMALWNITGQYAGNTPWSKFSAMAIIVALPVSV